MKWFINSAENTSYISPFAALENVSKSVQNILNGKYSSILDLYNEADIADVLAGTSTVDISTELQALIDEMSANGGGTIQGWPGAQIYLSKGIVLKQKVRLINNSTFAVGKRSDLSPFGLMRIKGSPTIGSFGDLALITIDSECAGVEISGLLLDCTDMVAGAGLLRKGGGFALRYNSLVQHCMIINSPEEGIKYASGVGGSTLQYTYVYNSYLDNLFIETGCDDNFFFRVFVSNSRTAYGIENYGASGRWLECDTWANKLDGIYDDSTNNDYIRLQSDLNERHGANIQSTITNKKRRTYIDCTFLSNSYNNPNLYNEVKISDTVQDVIFDACRIGSFPASGPTPNFAAYAVFTDAVQRKCVTISNCHFPSEVYTKGIFNGNARRWLNIVNCYDSGDDYTGQKLDFPDATYSLIKNPDCQNSANLFTLSPTPPVATGFDDLNIGRCALITPAATDADQYLDYQFSALAQNYRGRRVNAVLVYVSPITNTKTKTVTIRLGVGVVSTATIINDGEPHELILPNYKVGSETGACVVRIKVKSLGDGALQEPLYFNSLNVNIY